MMSSKMSARVLTRVFGASAMITCACDDTTTAPNVAETEQPLDIAIKTKMTFGDIPGVAIALVDEHGILLERGYGLADLQAVTPVTPDTSFWLASITKTITATALAQAMEAGKLTLNTDVKALLKRHAGFEIAVPAEVPITLRSLVTHTSPISDTAYYACSYFVRGKSGAHRSLLEDYGTVVAPDLVEAGLVCDDGAPVDLGSFLHSYLATDGIYYDPKNVVERTQPPPDNYEYSNVGAALAGYTLELAGVGPLAEVAAKRIFRPLCMRDTSFELAALDVSKLATPYAWQAEQQKYVPLPEYSLSTYPDGALRSSAHDLGRFLAMIMAQGCLDGQRILQPATVQTMLEPIVRNVADGNIGIFWDTVTSRTGRTLIGHTGGDPGAATAMFFDPKAKVGYVFLSNTDEERLAEVIDADLGEQLLVAAEQRHKEVRTNAERHDMVCSTAR